MSNIDTALARFAAVPAKFVGAAQIGLVFNHPQTISTNDLIARMKRTLTAKGWRVTSIVPGGVGKFFAQVTGSTSDNLKTVARNFENTLNRNGFVVSNTTAEFIPAHMTIASPISRTVSNQSVAPVRSTPYQFITAGPASGTISLFNFQWMSAYSTPYGNLDREAHASFNRALIQTFPKRLYTNPFSSYVDKGLTTRSRLYALAETTLSPSETKARIIELANQAGIQGSENNIIFGQKTINEIRQGQSLPDPGNAPSLNSLTKKAMGFDEWFRETFDISPTAFFPISYAVAIGGGVLLLLLITRR